MEDLPDFEDLDELLQGHAEPELVEKKANAYAGVSTSFFRDFSLKPEILRAITDKGWEAPSEGEQRAEEEDAAGAGASFLYHHHHHHHVTDWRHFVVV
eukprot:EC790046.1.p3 GENE.EC790046.1~~EC790046.1.p3  ORF type:complete len:98 (+),score=27.73 EC790046.1:3-296(+)